MELKITQQHSNNTGSTFLRNVGIEWKTGYPLFPGSSLPYLLTKRAKPANIQTMEKTPQIYFFSKKTWEERGEGASIEHKPMRRRRKNRKETSWEKEEMRDTHFHLCKKLKTPSPGWWEGIKLGVLKWCSLWLCCPPSYCCSPFRVRICRWLLFDQAKAIIIGSHIKTQTSLQMLLSLLEVWNGAQRLATSQPNSTRLHYLC